VRSSIPTCRTPRRPADLNHPFQVVSERPWGWRIGVTLTAKMLRSHCRVITFNADRAFECSDFNIGPGSPMHQPRTYMNQTESLTTAETRHAHPTSRQLAMAALAGAAFAVVSAVGASPAHAIKCDDEFQITSRGLVATPFCEANYLARVARSFGIRVSGRSIRRNSNKKREICYFIGHDIRVQDICAGYRDSPFLPPW
jgi:hypothetical protein